LQGGVVAAQCLIELAQVFQNNRAVAVQISYVIAQSQGAVQARQSFMGPALVPQRHAQHLLKIDAAMQRLSIQLRAQALNLLPAPLLEGSKNPLS
jgi:hypothetical protein